MNFLSAKDPKDTRLMTIDFTDRLLPGETIQSATWLVELDDGTPVDATSIIVGTPDWTVQPLVKQMVTGGNHESTYFHRAVAITNLRPTGIAFGAFLQIIKGA